jgi:hypothetical protein
VILVVPGFIMGLSYLFIIKQIQVMENKWTANQSTCSSWAVFQLAECHPDKTTKTLPTRTILAPTFTEIN